MKSDEGVAHVDAPRRAIAGVVALAIAVGAFLSLRGSGELLLYGDEFHSLRYVERPYGDLVGLYGQNGLGGALPLLQHAAIDVFGPGLRAFRLPAILGAIATLLLMYPAGVRLVGRTPAAIATLALAVNSVHVFYSRFGRAYALAVFLGLCLVYALTRALDRAGPKPVWYAVAAVSAGLLPYVYLSAMVFTATIALAAFATVSFRDAAGRHGLWLLGAFSIAAGLCFALYLPAWEPLWKFVRFESGRGASLVVHWLDAAALLAGSRAVAVVWLACVPAAAAWLLVRKRGEAIILIIAAFAMPFALLLAGPVGGPYATAPYLLVGLPFLLLLLAWAIVASVRAMGLPRRVSGYAELAAGVLAVVVAFAAGPLGLRRVDDGPFAASYLSLMPLPAFDEPWPGGPAVYEIFAQADRPLRLVEAPDLADHAVALYRNYYLQHGRPIAIGTVTEGLPIDSEGFHVPVSSVDATTADYLIVHVDVARELERYWEYVYQERWRSDEEPGLAAFMAFHEDFSVRPPLPLHKLVPGLRRRLGKPFYRDEDVVVWELEP
jgi:hypothetical protein